MGQPSFLDLIEAIEAGECEYSDYKLVYDWLDHFAGYDIGIKSPLPVGVKRAELSICNYAHIGYTNMITLFYKSGVRRSRILSKDFMTVDHARAIVENIRLGR